MNLITSGLFQYSLLFMVAHIHWCCGQGRSI